MSSNLQYGYPQVPKSITNPNVLEQNALDLGAPMSFLLFIKTISVSFEPEILQSFYNEYIKRWNLKKKNSDIDNKQTIADKYRDFIKDVNINHTTLEERQFLQKINFNDPLDLDTVLGFYSKKLIEISKYYNSKRDDAKYEISRKKLKGSNLGLEKTILEKTIEFLKNQENALIEYDVNEIKSKIKIDIQELYNLYGLYFDQTPDIKVYDYKDLDYGENIFLKDDQELIEKVFAGVSDEIRSLKEVDQLFENKRRLTKKSMSSDFYYISTGSTSTDFVSGKLFESTDSSKNILNRRYPTTASTIKGNLLTKEDIGFFKPSKTAIVLIDGKNESFEINFDKLQPNSLYFFPDPSIFGSNNEFLTFFVDGEYLKRNQSSSSAINQPVTNKNDTKYYGYISRKSDEFDQNFESIFESGFISDQKSDIFGNKFGLFKNDNFFKSTIQTRTPNYIKSLLLNGYNFFDELYDEGYNFNYFSYDDTTYLETLRSGISSNTNSFSSTSAAWTLFFRNFVPYQELKSPSESSITPNFKIRDGAIFTKSDEELLFDPISSDLNNFPGASVYYYTTLFDAGVHTATPLQRALKDTLYPSITANFLQSVRSSSGNDILNVDGGKFTTQFTFDYSFNEVEYAYIDETSNNTTLSIDQVDNSNYNNRIDLNGQIFVKNSETNSTNPLLTEFSYLTSKYNNSVISQLSSVSKFELSYNTLCIETDNYLIFEKINYENSKFNNSKTQTYVIQHNTNDVNRLSNRFKIETDIYYCVLNSTTPTISSNNYILYPEIYKYNTLTDVNLKIFPINDTDYTSNLDFFTIYGNTVRYDIVEKPILVYNSTNKIYNISFLVKDQNNMLSLHEFDFILNPNVQFIKHQTHVGTDKSYSNIMSPSYTSLLNVYLQSTPTPSIINEEFIL